MKVLFLAACSQRVNLYGNASVRYRCYNPAEDLNAMGLLANVCHVTDFCESWTDYYDVFIFHRPTNEPYCKKVILQLKEKSKVLVADYDDLLFGEKNVLYSPSYINGTASKRLAMKANESYTKALDYFDLFTVSTEPLAKCLVKINPNAQTCVIHNGISQRWFELAGMTRPVRNKVIGYFAGGACHNKDFFSIISALGSCLDSHDDIQLLVPEMLSVPKGILAENKLSFFKRKHFLCLPEVMAKCSLNIAPLLDNEFNRCKSAIKFLESAAVGVPLVATSIPDFERFSFPGLRFAASLKEWDAQLGEIQGNSTAMHSMLRDYVLSEGMSLEQSVKLTGFLERVI